MTVSANLSTLAGQHVQIPIRDGAIGLLDRQQGTLKLPRKVRGRYKAKQKEAYLKRGDLLDILKTLDHPNLMRVYDYDDDWVTVEYVDGLILSNREKKAPPQHESCYLDVAEHIDLRPIWSAVEYMHAHGLCHTDINSHNIIVQPNGTMKLIDVICCLPFHRRKAERDWKMYRSIADQVGGAIGEDQVVSSTERSDIMGLRTTLGIKDPVYSDLEPAPPVPNPEPSPPVDEVHAAAHAILRRGKAYHPLGSYGGAEKGRSAETFERRWEMLSTALSEYGAANFCDLGCAEGYYVRNAAREHKIFALGIDRNTTMLRRATAVSLLDADLSCAFMQLELTSKTLYMVPSFDAISCMSVLHHIIRRRGMKEAKSMLRAIASKTRKFFIFDMGSPEETENHWAKHLSALAGDVENNIAKMLTECGFRNVRVVGHSDGYNSTAQRPMFVGEPEL